MDTQQKKSIFEALDSKQSFILGCVATVLVLGTVGCLALGGYVWKNGVQAAVTDTGEVATDVAVNPAPTAAVSTTSDVTGTFTAVSNSDHVLGSGDITIVTYSDFQCPYCQRFDTSLQQVADVYEGKVKLVFRNFPLSFHPEAQNSAEAAECAAKQGKFWEYSVKLFENQSTLGEVLYKQIASDIGLNTTTFASCRSSDETLADILADQTEAQAAGVRGTPATFIVGKDGSVKQINGGAVAFSTLKTVIDQELAK